MLFAAMLPFLAEATAVRWLIPPTQDVMRYYKGVYAVRGNNNKWSLWDEGGKVLYDSSVPDSKSMAFDKITPVQNGYGLLLKVDIGKKRYRLCGVYDAASGSVKMFGGNPYYVSTQLFFDDNGRIAAQNSEDLFGFIDTDCRPLTKFAYSEAYPYSEGLAAVATGINKKRRGFYIDMEGKEIAPSLPEWKEVVEATTFQNGRAVIVDKKGNSAIIDRSFNPAGSISLPLDLNDFHGIREKSGEFMAPEPSYLIPDKDPDIVPFEQDGVYGYTDDAVVLIFPQFDEAGDYINGGAIVRNVRGKGVVSLGEGDVTFNAYYKGEPSDTVQSSTIIVDYCLPEGSAEVSVLNLADDKGDKVAAPHDASRHRFTYFGVPGRKMVRMVADYNLVIYDGSFMMIAPEDKYVADSGKKKGSPSGGRKKGTAQQAKTVGSDLNISISPGTVIANASRRANVYVNIKNTSKTTKLVNVTIGGTAIPVRTYTVNLGPNSSRAYTVIFPKVIKEEKRNISVNVNGIKTGKTVTVKPPVIIL